MPITTAIFRLYIKIALKLIHIIFSLNAGGKPLFLVKQDKLYPLNVI